MSECVEEQQTRHYRGRWHGFGPVQDDEQLIFAVFDRTARNDDSLMPECFKQLSGSSESVGRARYVTRQVFDSKIAQPGMQAKGALIGIAIANTRSIRGLRTDITINHRTASYRSICVTDHVEAGDYDGHATMGYAEPIEALGQTLKGKKRMAVRMDLANQFSKIKVVQSHSWPARVAVLGGRLLSIVREASKTLNWSRST
jgi:hypothetical protein